MGYGYGGFPGHSPLMFHGFGFLLFILVVLLVILVAARKHRHMMAVHGAHGVHGSACCGHHGATDSIDVVSSADGSSEAVAILKRRLASGEITVEEYESVISHLG